MTWHALIVHTFVVFNLHPQAKWRAGEAASAGWLAARSPPNVTVVAGRQSFCFGVAGVRRSSPVVEGDQWRQAGLAEVAGAWAARPGGGGAAGRAVGDGGWAGSGRGRAPATS